MATDRVPPTTSNAGIAIERDEHSLTLGPDGPILLGFQPNRVGAPHAPNSYGGPAASAQAYGDIAGWQEAGEMVREAYTLHREDDDFGQPGTLVRAVLDDAARERLVGNVAGHLSDGVSAPVQAQAPEYWREVYQGVGDRIAAAVKPG